MSSLYVFLAFLAFTLFGYLSLVRILYKFQFGRTHPNSPELRSLSNLNALLVRLPQSILFISLPTVSLLLYWGWGPALLWLVISHLLIDTLANFFSNLPNAAKPSAELFLKYSDGRDVIRAWLSQLVLILLISAVVILLANMIDQQTGLLFALIGVLLSIHLLRTAVSPIDAIVKLFASIGLLLLGLTLAHQMGISVFGNWAPAPQQIPWLKFDNRSLLALFLLVAAVQLTRSASLHRGILNVVGVIAIALILILIGSLVWLQPTIDAPLLSADQRSPSLPSFMAIFLMISATALGLLNQLTNAPSKPDSPVSAENSFVQRQVLSLVILLFSLALCTWLATASGIGAWNTHYAQWPEGATLQKHFALVLRTVAFASGSETSSTSVSFTLLVIAFCLFGVATLLTLLKLLKAKSTHAAHLKEQTFLTTGLAKINVQYIMVFLLCCWLLSNGIPVFLWVAIMALCWLMLCDVLLDKVASIEGFDIMSFLARGFVLLLTSLGTIQIFWLGLAHTLDGRYAYAVGHCFTLILAALLLSPNLVKCINQLQKKPNPKLFEND